MVDELSELVRPIYKDSFEKVSSPLDSVFDQVREVLESTDGKLFFLLVRCLSIALGEFRQDDL